MDVLWVIPAVLYLLFLFIKKYILFITVFVLLIAGLKWGRNIKFTKRNIIILLSVAFISVLVFIANYTNPFNRFMRDLQDKHSIYKVKVEQSISEKRLKVIMSVSGIKEEQWGDNITYEQFETLKQIHHELIVGINQKEISDYLKRRYSIFRGDDVSIQLHFENKAGILNLATMKYYYITSENYNGSEWFTEENKKVQKWYYSDVAGPSKYYNNPKFIYYTEILEELEKQEIDNKQPNDK